MANLLVANTILAQLGGRRFQLLTGAKGFIGSENSLSFKIGRNSHAINGVRIVLDPSDTYTVEFYRGRKLASTHTDIYCGGLTELFTRQTGLHTSL